MRASYIYIITNKGRTIFYTGVTTNLAKRITQHKLGIGSKFTQRYNIKDLIYFEKFSDVNQAIDREKQLKNWHRKWKINLIKTINPTLKTLEY